MVKLIARLMLTKIVGIEQKRLIETLTTVMPEETDPEEPAQVILWAPFSVIDDDDDVGADDELMQQQSLNKSASNLVTPLPAGYLQAAQCAVAITNLTPRSSQSKENVK